MSLAANATSSARWTRAVAPLAVRSRRQRPVEAEVPPWACRCQAQDKPGPAASSSGSDKDPSQVTEKYGLEAGIFSALRNKDGQATAKDLLKRYGAAYLVTSITLALITFSLCYVAVDSGVDVPALLARVGIAVGSNSAGEKAGTLALAYAAHKALSPVRFPPTVALTPLVARRFGKGDEGTVEKAE